MMDVNEDENRQFSDSAYDLPHAYYHSVDYIQMLLVMITIGMLKETSVLQSFPSTCSFSSSPLTPVDYDLEQHNNAKHETWGRPSSKGPVHWLFFSWEA